MATTVISIGPFRDVHDIDVATTNGRRCTIDIYKNDSGFDSEVTILDSVSSPSGSWVYSTKPASDSAMDNFDAAIELIKKYLSQVDPQDSIKYVHNPCNTPFISEADQNSVLSNKGISLSVRVN
ncbi:hypothetical protein SSPSH_000841 [Salinisphaera shabanensis E1L3A]|mgnify:CR=1 FL=1|uniref:Uncharacterized protein n=1 Tax=Salinisphaera shabanensis E1L3A TaxID=1033802 RepID=U2EPG1_9GAMM|nr:hypothetical protein [Salinisphaera shabanensis]ERJ19977.1 hypothetical protein SSPSH_000841 [Salinisphaera shabanensis E1L3A]